MEAMKKVYNDIQLTQKIVKDLKENSKIQINNKKYIIQKVQENYILFKDNSVMFLNCLCKKIIVQ